MKDCSRKQTISPFKGAHHKIFIDSYGILRGEARKKGCTPTDGNSMREAAVKLQNLDKDLKIFSAQGREKTFGPQQNYTSTAPLIILNENKQPAR